MSKINPKSLVSILTVICIVISMICSKPIRAVTEGRGARIVIWDEWGQAKFHIGMTPGSHVKLTAEATGQAEISDVIITSSQSDVCLVEEDEEYDDCYEATALKEGTSVLTMTCKAGTQTVKRSLLISVMTYYEQASEGKVRSGATVYYGCSDQAEITSKSTEVKAVLSEDKAVNVVAGCGEFCRVELPGAQTFGESNEFWGYVKKSDIYIPVKKVQIDQELLYYEGEDDYFHTEIIPTNATNTKVTYQSSNTKVVTVEPDGHFHAVGIGSAVVTVTSVQNPECQAKCRMTIKPYIPVQGYEFIPASLDVEDGAKGEVQVKVIPEDASRPAYTLSSDDSSVMQLYSDGHYKAVNPGKTKLTATAIRDKVTSECPVTVRPVFATGVNLQKTLNMDIEEQKVLVWSMVPKNATNRKVTWKSSNPAIASVTKTGIVTANALGECEIEIKTADGGYTAKCKVCVQSYVQDIVMKGVPKKMELGKKQQIKAALTPAVPTIKKIVWKSSNPDVISVSSSGIIHAKQTGSAKIRVYDRYTGAQDFRTIVVNANLKKTELKGKKKGKGCTLSWKKVKHATNYVIYQKKKKAKKYKKYATVSGSKTKYQIKNVEKGNSYKIRAYYKPNKEYSKYSNAYCVKK